MSCELERVCVTYVCVFMSRVFQSEALRRPRSVELIYRPDMGSLVPGICECMCMHVCVGTMYAWNGKKDTTGCLITAGPPQIKDTSPPGQRLFLETSHVIRLCLSALVCYFWSC